MEDKLTAAASGSLERLFDAVPSTATLVEVEEGGAPRTATAHQVWCAGGTRSVAAFSWMEALHQLATKRGYCNARHRLVG
jgi:hypothetical protein